MNILSILKFADLVAYPTSMDSRVAILGANGAGKSTLLNLITGALQPCEGTVSKHAALKLAKYSQHSADQLPYDRSPIEHFQSLFYDKYPDKDVHVFFHFFLEMIVMPMPFFHCRLGGNNLEGLDSLVHIRPLRSDSCRMVCAIGEKYIIAIQINPMAYALLCRSVVFAQLAMEHPHVLLLGKCRMTIALTNIYL